MKVHNQSKLLFGYQSYLAIFATLLGILVPLHVPWNYEIHFSVSVQNIQMVRCAALRRRLLHNWWHNYDKEFYSDVKCQWPAEVQTEATILNGKVLLLLTAPKQSWECFFKRLTGVSNQFYSSRFINVATEILNVKPYWNFFSFKCKFSAFSGSRDVTYIRPQTRCDFPLPIFHVWKKLVRTSFFCNISCTHFIFYNFYSGDFSMLSCLAWKFLHMLFLIVKVRFCIVQREHT